LALRAPCPTRSAAQCWGVPMEVPCFGGTLEQGRDGCAALARKRIRLVRARSAIACARVYNEMLALEGSKVVVDLRLFERLLLDARRAAAEDIDAVCGMVGGIRKYRAYFGAFDAEAVSVV